jgi:hypothetical protein
MLPAMAFVMEKQALKRLAALRLILIYGQAVELPLLLPGYAQIFIL